MAKFAYSRDGETFSGDYDSLEEAVFEGLDGTEDSTIWAGECVSPTQPEDWWQAVDWLEHVSCQDEYCGDHADDWDGSTKAQREELESLVRPVLAAWLDRHNLRPLHYAITNVAQYELVDDKPVIISAT